MIQEKVSTIKLVALSLFLSFLSRVYPRMPLRNADQKPKVSKLKMKCWYVIKIQELNGYSEKRNCTKKLFLYYSLVEFFGKKCICVL
jgi:hypothetical protein